MHPGCYLPSGDDTGIMVYCENVVDTHYKVAAIIQQVILNC